MQHRQLGQIAAALLATFVTGTASAWAVTVTVKVTDTGGAPVAGATVDLGLGGPVATTDDRGEVVVDVPDSEMEREREVVITPRGGTPHIERRRIVENMQVALPPWVMPQGPPARRFGCNAAGGGFQLAFGAGRTDFDNVPLERQEFRRRGFVGNQQVFEDAGTRNAEQVAEINQTQDKPKKADSAPGVQVTIPLWPNRCDGGNPPVIPSVFAGVDRADVTFDSLTIGMPAFNQTFTGSGTAFRFGVQAGIPIGDSPVIIGAGYQQARSTDIRMTRSVDPADAFFPIGAVTLQDGENTYSFRLHTFTVTAGVIPNGRLYAYGGVAFNRWTSTIDLTTRVDITGTVTMAPVATQIVQEDWVLNTFRENYGQVIGGIGVKVAGPLGVGAEGGAGGDNFYLRLQALLFLP